MKKLVWESNPHAYGAISAHLEGTTKYVGGIAATPSRVSGWYRTKLIFDEYNGLDDWTPLENEAMAAVEAEHVKFSEMGYIIEGEQ